MPQIISKVKDDLSVVFLLSSFVGHPVTKGREVRVCVGILL